MMKKRWTLVAALILALSVLFCGCSHEADLAAEEAVMEKAAAGDANYYLYAADVGTYTAHTSAAEAPEAETTSDSVSDGRKLIQRISLTIETEKFDEYINSLDGAVAACGGYVEASSVGGTDTKWANYTVRIPVSNLDRFMTEMSQKGVVAEKSTSQEDVTLEYVDTEAHVTALRTEETSLLRLLEQAETVEDIMSIQSRLSDVRYEIERYESQLRSMDNLIDYVTVSFSISQVAYEQPVTEDPSAWDEIGANLKDNIYGIGQFFRGLFVGLASALPFLAIILVILLPIIIFGVVIPRRKRKKAAQAAQEQIETE